MLLVERGALDEATALLEERERWVREQKITLWDPQIGELRRLIASRAGN